MMSGLLANARALLPGGTRFRFLLSGSAGSFLLLSSILPAQAQTTWVDGTGNWFTAGNWDNGVPTAGSTANVSNGGTSQIGGAASVATLNITGGSTVVMQSNASSLSAGATVNLGTAGNTGTLQFDDAFSLTFANAISGTGSVLITGLGGQTFTGTNTYTGGTTIVQGAILIGNGGTTGSIVGDVVVGVTSAGGINFNRSDNITFAGYISGLGYVAQQTTGTLTLTGNNTYAGYTDIVQGTVAVSSDSNLGASSAYIRLASERSTLQFLASFDSARNIQLLFVGSPAGFAGTIDTNGNTSTLSGVISGDGLIKKGAGTLVLSNAANTYNGGTTVTGGALSVSSDANLGATTGGLTLNGGTLQMAGGASFILDSGRAVSLGASGGTIDTNGGGLTIAQGISGSGGLTKIGVGLLNLVGNNTYAGLTLVSAGALSVGNGGTVGSIAGNIDVEAQLNFNRSDALTYGGVISGAGRVLKLGSGTLTLTSGLNSFTGGLFVNAGKVALSGNGALSSDSQLVVNTGGTFDISAANGDRTVGTVSNNTGAAILLGANTLTINENSPSNVSFFSGVISGTGGIGKVGIGKLLLSGTNTYTGTTTISVGTLSVTGGSAISDAGTVNIASGAVFELDASETIGGLQGAGNVNLQTFTLTANANNSSTTYSGGLFGNGGFTKVGSGTLSLTGFSNFTGATTISAGTLQFGNGGTTGTMGLGSVVDNSAIAFNHSNAFGLSNVITGTGGIAQIGTGTTTLSANNSFAGQNAVQAGTLVLAGTNSYSGQTFIDAGATLALTGNGSISSSSNVSVTGTFDISGTNAGATIRQMSGNGGTVVLGNKTLTISNGVPFSGSSVFGGHIGGTGGVTISGGAEQFTASNTYTGITTIAGGAQLTISNAGTIAASSSVADGGTLQFDTAAAIQALTGSGVLIGNVTITNAAGTFAGNIGGGGGANVTVSGGTQTFSGGSSAFGSLTAGSGGTIVLTGGGAFSAYTLVVNGTFDISGTSSGAIFKSLGGAGSVILGSQTLTLGNAGALSNVDFSGIISGTGGLALANIGDGSAPVRVLSGANTYSGLTTIGSGEFLQIGNGGATGTLGSGAVVDNGTLTFKRNNALLVANAISGSGTLVQATAGTTILTGNNSYTGNTTVQGTGTLQLGNGGATGSIVGNVASSGTLVFDRSDSIGFAGVISGSGKVTQAGTGITTLSATNTYAGTTTVNAGTLAVNGSIATSTVTVNSSGTLGGTGTVGSTTVQSGGVLAPGNSIGTLHVNGSLTLAAGSTTVIEVDPSSSDQVLVTGVVSIAGQLFVNFAAGSYGPKQYTILTTTGSINGTFAGFDSLGLPQGFIETVSYDAHDVFLNLIPADFIWSGAPASSDWNTGGNWKYGVVPSATDTAKFQATTQSSIDIRQATSIASLQFDTATPTYTFNITGGAGGAASLTVSGLGIVDAPGNGPTFNVSGTAANGGTLTFANAATAGDARIVASAFGTVAFTGTSNAGASAQLIAASGGTVDFSGTTGSANDKNVSAGSIAGAGSFKLGGDRLSVGANNASTEVSGVIADGGALGGSGASLVKVGTGTLILSGANTYTGGTTVSTGTLQLGNGGTSGTILGNVTDNATLTFNRSDAVSFGGVISGSGAVVQAGTGTTTLTASNTYSGGTTVSTGALQIGNGGAAGAIIGNVLDNASLMFNRSDAVTFGGVISGTGGVTQAGSGTTTFTAANTYSGGTTILAGALQLGTGGDILGNVVDNALLIFNRSGTNTFGGAISGTGALTQAQGTLIFTGASTYTGTTTIAVGATLQLGNGATGSLAGPIVDNGVFDIHHTNDLIVPSAISGSGALVQSGSGKSILTGASSYAGGTTISTGSLQLGNGGTSGSIVGNVTDNATLIFNRTDTITFAGVISGTGGLTHDGTGTTILTGIDTYSGPTVVNAGVLDVNGSIANSAVTTNGGGVVKGNGTLGSISLAPGAHIAPGNSIGTLTIAGGIAFAAGTTYDVEADTTGAADRINAGGAATILGGTVAVAAAPGIYTGLTYRILSATGGVSGTFTGLTTGSPALIARLTYGPTTVDLFLVSDIDFAPLTQSSNEAATAAAVKAGGAASILYNAFLIQQPNKAFIPAALDQLSGTLHPDLRSALLQDSRTVRQTLLGRLRQATAGAAGPDARDIAPGVTAWLRVLSGWGSIDGDGNAAMLDQANSGVLGGIDARLTDDLRAGLAGGYTHSNVNTDAHSANATSGTGHVAGYAGWSDGSLKLRVAAAYGWGNVSTLRAVQFPGFSNTLTGKQGEHTTQAFAEIGDVVDGGWFAFEPFAGINWVQAGTGSFAETGGAAALSGNGGTSTATYSSLGLRLGGAPPAGDGFAVTPHIALSWEHAFGSLHPRDTVTFLATAQSFATLGVPLASDALSTEASIDIRITPHGRIGLGYDGFLSGSARNNAVRADLSWDF